MSTSRKDRWEKTARGLAIGLALTGAGILYQAVQEDNGYDVSKVTPTPTMTPRPVEGTAEELELPAGRVIVSQRKAWISYPNGQITEMGVRCLDVERAWLTIETNGTIYSNPEQVIISDQSHVLVTGECGSRLADYWRQSRVVDAGVGLVQFDGINRRTSWQLPKRSV